MFGKLRVIGNVWGPMFTHHSRLHGTNRFILGVMRNRWGAMKEVIYAMAGICPHGGTAIRSRDRFTLRKEKKKSEL